MEEFNSSLEQAIAQRQQRLLMDSLSMFGLGKWASGSYNQFLLIFDKSSPASTVHYLLIDTSGKKPQIHPKVNTVHMTKLTDVIGYRIAILLDSLYVMGGKHTLSDAYLSNCYSYDAMTNQWSRRAAMNKARIRFSATVINGILYICGGETRGGSITDAVEAYDPTINCWTQLHQMPVPRADHAACSMNGLLFVSGGVGQQKGGIQTFWMYNPATDHWIQSFGVSALPNPHYLHCMVANRNRIYCIGGISTTKKGQRLVDHEEVTTICFDCGKATLDGRIIGEWDTQFDILNESRSMASTFRIGNTIFLIGGYSYAEQRSRVSVEHLNLRTRTWQPAFTLGDDKGICAKNVDCCLLKVPTTNREFSHLGYALSDKWVLW